MSELISIVIPVYNVKKYIDRCLDSVINQTYQNIEVILIDDGSTDGSSEKCEEWSRRDLRIRVFHKENGGLSEVRNIGIGVSSGKYILFVDSDDCISRDMCSKLLKMLLENEADIAVGGVNRFTDFPTVTNISEDSICVDKYYALEQIATDYRWCVAWGKLYRREILSDIRYPKGKIHEDEFVIHQVYYKCRRIVYTDDALYHYYYNSNGITSGKFSAKRLDFFEALDARKQFYLEKGEEHLYQLTIMEEILAMVRYSRMLKENHEKAVAARMREECRKLFKANKKGCKIRMWKYPHVYAYIYPQCAPIAICIRGIKKIMNQG